MHRRNFLGVLFGAALSGALPVSAIAAIAPDLLRLWGDGVHDDTAALQALISRGGTVYIPPGRYLVSRS